MKQMVMYLRPPVLAKAGSRVPTRGYLRGAKWREMSGVRHIPFIDDYLFLCQGYKAALALRSRLSELFDSLGLVRNEKKGHWEPTQ